MAPKRETDEASGSGSGGAATESGEVEPRRTIIIHHNSGPVFTNTKNLADKIKDELEKAIPGVNVRINPSRPRSSYHFEIVEHFRALYSHQGVSVTRLSMTETEVQQLVYEIKNAQLPAN